VRGCAAEGDGRVGDVAGQLINRRDVALGNPRERHSSIAALVRGDGSGDALAVTRPQVAEPCVDLRPHLCRQLGRGQLLSEVCGVVDQALDLEQPNVRVQRRNSRRELSRGRERPVDHERGLVQPQQPSVQAPRRPTARCGSVEQLGCRRDDRTGASAERPRGALQPPAIQRPIER
jgi:hypothetical protein